MYDVIDVGYDITHRPDQRIAAFLRGWGRTIIVFMNASYDPSCRRAKQSPTIAAAVWAVKKLANDIRRDHLRAKPATDGTLRPFFAVSIAPSPR